MKNRLYLLLILLVSFNVKAQDSKKVNFDEKFKKENQGKSKITINEVKELLHIMIAITESGLDNDDMVNQKGNYYNDVIKYFEPFKNEPVILKFDSLIKSNPLNYIFLTGNAISYNFKGKELVKDKNYIFPAQGVSSHTVIKENLISIYKNDIERFSNKSDFRNFYKSSKKYYDKIISDYNNQANISQQWKWLETNFETKINNYVIMTSPLIEGLNYTTSFEDNNFTQILLVVPPISNSEQLTEMENIISNTRNIFTEIDHNYVGNPTKKFENQVNEALKNREVWVNTSQTGTEYYPTPSKVFDEYMTWAVYCLYVLDVFKGDQEAFNYVYKDINSVMAERGFPKIKDFNDKLIQLRKNNEDKKIEELYPELIDWCKMQ